MHKPNKTTKLQAFQALGDSIACFCCPLAWPTSACCHVPRGCCPIPQLIQPQRGSKLLWLWQCQNLSRALGLKGDVNIKMISKVILEPYAGKSNAMLLCRSPSIYPSMTSLTSCRFTMFHLLIRWWRFWDGHFSAASYSEGFLQLQELRRILQDPQAGLGRTTEPRATSERHKRCGGSTWHDSTSRLSPLRLQKPRDFSEAATGAAIWKPSGKVAPRKNTTKC